MQRTFKEISSDVSMPRTVENINPPEEITPDADTFAGRRQDLHNELGVVEARRAQRGAWVACAVSALPLTKKLSPVRWG